MDTKRQAKAVNGQVQLQLISAGNPAIFWDLVQEKWRMPAPATTSKRPDSLILRGFEQSSHLQYFTHSFASRCQATRIVVTYWSLKPSLGIYWPVQNNTNHHNWTRRGGWSRGSRGGTTFHSNGLPSIPEKLGASRLSAASI